MNIGPVTSDRPFRLIERNTWDAGEEAYALQTAEVSEQSESEKKFKLVLEELAGEKREARNFVRRLRPDLLLRPLFRCSNDLVGAGWHGMAENDILVLLFGRKVPVILRSHGDFFGIAGDACVPGIMTVCRRFVTWKEDC